jgi:hypothetical protein
LGRCTGEREKRKEQEEWDREKWEREQLERRFLSPLLLMAAASRVESTLGRKRDYRFKKNSGAQFYDRLLLFAAV